MPRDFDIAFIVCGNRVLISHLQFADNTNFFLGRVNQSIFYLNLVLKIFCNISGMKINMEKSVIAKTNMDEDELSTFSHASGYNIENW